MKILGWTVETPSQTRSRKLYHKSLIDHLEEKYAEDTFVAYLNGLKEGMRLARVELLNSDPYSKIAMEYNPKKIH